MYGGKNKKKQVIVEFLISGHLFKGLALRIVNVADDKKWYYYLFSSSIDSSMHTLHLLNTDCDLNTVLIQCVECLLWVYRSYR